MENEETGQTVHKRAALAFWQKQAKDAKPGAGHQQRYVTGERQPIIAEDTGTALASHALSTTRCTSATAVWC